MTYSVIFRQLPRQPMGSHIAGGRGGCRVTVLEPEPSHRRSRRAQSPWSSSNGQLHQLFQEAAPAQNAGRRIEAGAGVTSVFVAVIRHETSLVRWLSLVGRSRTCPSSLILNLNEIRIENKSSPRSKRHGNSHS